MSAGESISLFFYNDLQDKIVAARFLNAWLINLKTVHLSDIILPPQTATLYSSGPIHVTPPKRFVQWKRGFTAGI